MVKFSALLVAFLIQASPLKAELDMGRLVMGRTTYPAGSWALDSFHNYSAPRLKEPGADRLQSEVELERGETERFGWELGLKTSRLSRQLLQWDRAFAEARLLTLERPLQLAAAANVSAPLRGGRGEGELELEALKNWGAVSWVLQCEAELEGGGDVSGSFVTAPLFRFGLQGLAGPAWSYDSGGRHSIGGVVGGAVSRSLFLGLQPRVGLSRRSPDVELLLELHLFFGPYSLGGWGLQ